MFKGVHEADFQCSIQPISYYRVRDEDGNYCSNGETFGSMSYIRPDYAFIPVALMYSETP